MNGCAYGRVPRQIVQEDCQLIGTVGAPGPPVYLLKQHHIGVKGAEHIDHPTKRTRLIGGRDPDARSALIEVGLGPTPAELKVPTHNPQRPARAQIGLRSGARERCTCVAAWGAEALRHMAP